MSINVDLVPSIFWIGAIGPGYFRGGSYDYA